MRIIRSFENSFLWLAFVLVFGLTGLGIASETGPAGFRNFPLVPVTGHLTITTKPVELDVVTVTYDESTVNFGNKKISGDLVEKKRVESKRKATLVEFSTDASRVVVFDTQFNIGEVFKVSDREYLVMGKPGKYLLIAETDDGQVYQPILVEGSILEPTPIDPSPDFGELAKLSADLARRLNDRITEARLNVVLGQPITETTLEGAKLATRNKVREVMSTRTGDSLKADWLGGWRRPLDEKLDSITTLEDYKKAIQQIRSGLRPETSSVRVAPSPGATAPARVVGPPLPTARISNQRQILVRECTVNG